MRIFVAGATGAIGSATARRLAASGRRLHLVARDPARPSALARELGAGSAACDVRDEAGTPVALTGAEFDLLLIFLERPHRVLSRETLLDLLHGRVSADSLDRTIDVTMSRLRRKFGDNGVFRLFKTVRNGGYQFAARVEVGTS